eukprot:TRINITY_DN17966_c0_g1_i1.p2 TRINITY_DN17966_c0_g1~~TRINITY_DN17966_c0_g1_i1.p2  ORF type:complete len:201 (+),score=28.07 TRINITY_DN17966_c0_g1_i1:127-729(+)
MRIFNLNLNYQHHQICNHQLSHDGFRFKELLKIKVKLLIMNFQVNELNEQKLFEQFLLIGVERKDINEYQQELKVNQCGLLPPKKLFVFPKSDQDRSYSQLINGFVFPFGVLTTKLPEDFDDLFVEINQILGQTVPTGIKETSFVITLSQESSFSAQNNQESLLSVTNPKNQLYAICFQCNDYYDLNENSNNEEANYEQF